MIHRTCLSTLFFHGPKHSFLEHSNPRQLWTLTHQLKPTFIASYSIFLYASNFSPSLSAPTPQLSPPAGHHSVFLPGKQPHWILGGRHWPDFNTNAPAENGTSVKNKDTPASKQVLQFLHRKGFRQPQLTTTTSGKEKAQTTKKCQTSRYQPFLSSSGVFSTKPD